MNGARSAGLLLGLLILQLCLGGDFVLGGAQPALLALGVLWLALRGRPLAAAAGALLFSPALDAFSIGPLGLSSLSLCLAAYLVYSLRSALGEAASRQGLCLALGLVLNRCLLFLLYALAGALGPGGLPWGGLLGGLTLDLALAGLAYLAYLVYAERLARRSSA